MFYPANVAMFRLSQHLRLLLLNNRTIAPVSAIIFGLQWKKNPAPKKLLFSVFTRGRIFIRFAFEISILWKLSSTENHKKFAPWFSYIINQRHNLPNLFFHLNCNHWCTQSILFVRFECSSVRKNLEPTHVLFDNFVVFAYQHERQCPCCTHHDTQHFVQD